MKSSYVTESEDSIIGDDISLQLNDAETAPLFATSQNNDAYGSVSKDIRRDNTQNRDDAEVNNDGSEQGYSSDIKNTNDYRLNYDCMKMVLIVISIIFCTIGIVCLNPPLSSHKSKVATYIGGSKSSGISSWVGSRQRPNAILTAKSVPFPLVDRSDYSEEASNIVFPHLFHPLLRYHPPTAIKSDNQTGTETETETGTETGSNSDDDDLPRSQGSTKGPLLNVPFPTGAFWTNLVIEPTADRGLSYPIMTYPYGYKWSPTMMQISYPPLRRLKDAISIRDIFNPDITFSIAETVTRRNIIDFDSLTVSLRFYSESADTVADGPPFAAGYDYNDDDVPHWESYLVQGSPYVTVTYMSVTPILTPLSTFQNFICPRDENGNYRDAVNESTEQTGQDYGVCSIISTTHSHLTILSGVQFLIGTQENLTWMLFASEPITLIFDKRTRTTITSNDKYQGTLRLALIPPALNTTSSNTRSGHYKSTPLSTSSAVMRLINHSHVYPIRSKVSWDFTHVAKKQQIYTSVFEQGAKKEYGNVGTLTFEFETRSMHDSADSFSNGVTHENDLMMLALPHHKEVLPTKMLLTGDTFDVTFHSIKGAMTPVLGNIWSYDESLTNVEFDSTDSLKMAASMDTNTRDIIINQVKQDLAQVLPSLQEDVYGFGKQVARLAQLAHIAFVLQPKPSTTESSKSNVTDAHFSLGDEAGKLLYRYLSKFLEGETSDKLVYDINFGGIITQNGLRNKQEDFGNGWYNDHHFHYGYLLYASAVMAKIDPTFVLSYGPHVDAIFNDVLHNPEQQSDMQFFPIVRHKSWFDGHSFASGLFPFGDGKSQESSSEAVNCYYGAYLWSLMRQGSDWERQTNFAKLLLAMEIRGAKTYWHMEPSSDSNNMDDIESEQIYDPKFESSFMVGNLGMMDVTVSTWFGTESLYVHMINVMPITEITRELFGKNYVKKEYEAVIKPIEDSVEMAWRGYTICDRAMIEPNKAWDQAIALKSYLLDSGTSLSQIYFWISTMTEFTSPSHTTSDDISKSGGTYILPQNHTDQLCTENESCNELNLTGLCCPTLQGIILGCCN